MKKPVAFEKESDLCAAFIGALPEGWTAYPETGGFDILLARKEDGFQIGVEAKLRLNAKVICQAAEYIGYHYVDMPGPDCRAVLVPTGVSFDLAELCPLIGITAIRMRDLSLDDAGQIRWYGKGRTMALLASGGYSNPFFPPLPSPADDHWQSGQWFELCPAERLKLPGWVPDVDAGASAPTALTDWKIRAIKIVITLAKRGYVTRKDFAHFKISMSRWTQGGWLQQDGRGGWIAGPDMPDFRAQHPVNFPQIEADFEKWKNPVEPNPYRPKQAALL